MTTTTAAAVLPLNDAGWPVAGAREQAADPTSRGAERIRVLIADDGRGFDPYASHPGHFGLQLMCEQAMAVGAALELVSAPGGGTQVRVRVGRRR